MSIVDEQYRRMFAELQRISATAQPDSFQQAVNELDIGEENALLNTEFYLHAARNEEARRRLVAHHRAVREQVGELVRQRLVALGLSTSWPVDVLATVFIALNDGLNIQRRVDPDAIPPTTQRTLFDLLASAIAGQHDTVLGHDEDGSAPS